MGAKVVRFLVPTLTFPTHGAILCSDTRVPLKGDGGMTDVSTSHYPSPRMQEFLTLDLSGLATRNRNWQALAGCGRGRRRKGFGTIGRGVLR